MRELDPDGRFRIGEFFCFDNTWRPALRSLVERARVVLMDLRGFTKANAGCVFELEQLKALGAAGRCVFVMDSTTDRALVETSLGLLRRIGAASLDHDEARGGCNAGAVA